MFCHETYRDINGNWLSPDEIVTIDGKKYQKNSDPKTTVEVGKSESMSKSKKNIIDPEKIFQNYGADAARLFIISDSPPEKDVQWSDEGIESSLKFIQKLWGLHQKITNEIQLKRENNLNNKLDLIVNDFIFKVEKNLENFRYNKIVANFHEIYSLLSKENLSNYASKNIRDNYKKFLIAITPVIPHFANECMELLNEKENIKWPKVDENNIKKEFVNYVIQINGKTRSVVNEKINLSKENLIELIKNNQKTKIYVQQTANIKKVIFIPNKLINIII